MLGGGGSKMEGKGRMSEIAKEEEKKEGISPMFAECKTKS